MMKLLRPACWLAVAVLGIAAVRAAEPSGAPAGSGAAPVPAAAAPTPAAAPGAAAPAPIPYGPGPVYVLTLQDEESPGASLYGLFTEWNTAHLRRSLERAKEAGASLFVIRLTTNGGLVNNAFRMSEALRKIQGMRTATLVNHRAISAGSLLSMSCDDIYMVPGSVIGDAYPISIVPGGKPQTPPAQSEPGAPETSPDSKRPEPLRRPTSSNEDKKQIGAIVAYFEAAAAQKGHPPALAAAMVDPDVEVLAVTSDGRRELVKRSDYTRKKAPLPDAAQEVKVEVEVIDSADDILILDTTQALELGLIRAQVEDLGDMLRREGLAGRQVVEIRLTLSERLARFFSSGLVVILLLAICVLALYTELQHPSGVAAGVFLLALGLFFWANYMAGTANAVSIILVLMGAALLAVEIFFFPGFGVAGISGAVLVALGLILARVPADLFSSPGPSPDGGYKMPSVGWGSVFAGAAVPVLVGLVLGAIGIAVLMRFFPHLPLLNRLVLQADLAGAVVTAGDPAGVRDPESLVGRTGTAATVLRPGGSVRFDGKLMDVISDGEFIEAGAQVRVVSADSNRIVVRRA